MGNGQDAGKGRQMPVHYGSRDLNNVTVSSPLSKFIFIQPLRLHRLLVLVMPLELPNRIELQLAI